MSKTTRLALFGVAAALSIGFLLSAQTASSQLCDPVAIKYSESRVGLDYRNLASSPIAEILSKGEEEYFQNANNLVVTLEVSEAEIPAVWKRQVNALLTSRLPDFVDGLKYPSVYFWRVQTPKTFQLLRRCVAPEDLQLGYFSTLTEFPETQSLNQ